MMKTFKIFKKILVTKDINTPKNLKTKIILLLTTYRITILQMLLKKRYSTW